MTSSNSAMAPKVPFLLTEPIRAGAWGLKQTSRSMVSACIGFPISSYLLGRTHRYFKWGIFWLQTGCTDGAKAPQC